MHQTGRVGATADLGAALYFWARVAYVILYALGVPLIRSLAWNVAIVGIAILVAGARVVRPAMWSP